MSLSRSRRFLSLIRENKAAARRRDEHWRPPKPADRHTVDPLRSNLPVRLCWIAIYVRSATVCFPALLLMSLKKPENSFLKTGPAVAIRLQR